jgi:hypothetical protein
LQFFPRRRKRSMNEVVVEENLTDSHRVNALAFPVESSDDM